MDIKYIKALQKQIETNRLFCNHIYEEDGICSECGHIDFELIETGM